MKKLISALFLGAVAISTALAQGGTRFEWDETGYYYPEQEPDDIWTDWEYFGTCDLEWSGLNSGFWTYDMKVNKRVSKDPENHKWQWQFEKYFAAGTPLIVEYDPDTKRFRIPVVRHGVNNMWDGEPFLATGWHEFYGEESDDPYSSWDDVNGKLNLFVMHYYPNQDNGDGTFSDHAYAYGTDKFYFKGFTKYDVDIDIEECVAQKEVSIPLNMTVHPKNVSWELVNEYVIPTDTVKLEEIAARKANPIDASTTVNVTMKEGVNTLVVSSYDDKNNLVSSIRNIFCMPEDAENWEARGTGKFTDDAVLGLGGDWTPTSVDVVVEENKAKPGYYRIKDPYQGIVAKWNDLTYDHTGHTHYLYFDASRPKQVMMEPTALGVREGKLGAMYLTSKAYEEKRAGKLQPEYTAYFGKLENGKITFPTGSIGIRLPEYTKVLGQDLIYWVNNNDMFMLELPSNGIEGIEAADNETAEYFSLQGLRIDRPADGQMVIVRKGGKSFKTVYRAH